MIEKRTGYSVLVVRHPKTTRGNRPGKVVEIVAQEMTIDRANLLARTLNKKFGPLAQARRSCIVMCPGDVPSVGTFCRV